MNGSPKDLSGDDIEDIKNARGCGIPDDRIAGHHGITVDQMLQAIGQPAKTTPAADVAADSCDLWAVDRLGDQL